MEERSHLEKEKLVIDIGKANIYSLVFCIPVVLLYGLTYYLIWGSPSEFFEWNWSVDSKVTLFDTYPFILFFLAGIVAHELIHGIVWGMCAKNRFKSIRFGMMWKYLCPYCHCKDLLTVTQYRIGAVAPAIVLGLLPGILALFIGSSDLLMLSMVMTIGGVGDFMILYLLRKEKSSDYVQDLPSEAGCYIYRQS